MKRKVYTPEFKQQAVQLVKVHHYFEGNRKTGAVVLNIKNDESLKSCERNGEYQIMRAVVWEKYGKPIGLKYREVEKPSPTKDEVLIRIDATTVSTGDTEMRGLKFTFLIRVMIRLYMGILKPRKKILGQELVGTIEAVRSEVSTFKVGDRVIATTGFKFGGYAEYICLRPHSDMGTMVMKPSFISDYEAAALPVAGMEVLHYLQLGKIKKGEHILINGAAGSFGTFAIQLAKYYEAEVTAVDALEKFEVLVDAGADHLIDYNSDSYYKNKDTYDIIFDIVSNTNFKKSLNCLKAKGRYVFVTPKPMYKLKRRLCKLGSKQVLFTLSKPSNFELENVIKLVKEASIKIYIDKVLSLEEIPEAHEYIEKGYKKGNLVVKVSNGDTLKV